jgi:uncharacterized repeat protein (TIGR04052 family)
MNFKKIISVPIFFSSLVFCTAETSNKDSDAFALLAVALNTPVSVNLDFEALANNQKFASGSNITADSRTVQFRDFRFYVSEVKLVRADGALVDVTLNTDNVWQANQVALVDLETTASTDTNSFVKGVAPGGIYSGVQYTIGVPEAMNHLNRIDQAAPLNIAAMYWSWQGGYKHAKIEFSFDSGGTWTNFHMGSTTCSGAPDFGNCTAKFRGTVQLTGSFNPASQKISLSVDQLINGHSPGASATCMPNQAGATCTPLLRSFGVNESNGSVDNNITQRVFSLN